jgi:hypothetical protein
VISCSLNSWSMSMASMALGILCEGGSLFM